MAFFVNWLHTKDLMCLTLTIGLIIWLMLTYQSYKFKINWWAICCKLSREVPFYELLDGWFCNKRWLKLQLLRHKKLRSLLTTVRLLSGSTRVHLLLLLCTINIHFASGKHRSICQANRLVRVLDYKIKKNLRIKIKNGKMKGKSASKRATATANVKILQKLSKCWSCHISL